MYSTRIPATSRLEDRAAQKALAAELTTLVHGQEAYDEALHAVGLQSMNSALGCT